MRPSSDIVWLEVAKAIAKRSRCVRSQVGAVIVGADGRVVSTGYNGPPASWEPATFNVRAECNPWCKRSDSGERAADFSDCPSVHAELNALLYSDRDHRIGGTLYLTRDPCWSCALAIAASGVTSVVWIGDVPATNRERQVDEFLHACNILVVKVPA